MAFVHLHAHTQYSIQDAVNKIDDYVDRVKELGQTACAITDHGVMYGVLQFYKKAKAAGIKPIIGCEMYLTDGDHKEAKPAKHANYYHLILLAENQTGYQNLVKLCTLGFTEGFYRKPRVDYELLRQYHEGLICLSACVAGELPRAILRNDFNAAREIIQKNVEIFGKENYFLEIQNHNTAQEAAVRQGISLLSRETGVAMVATADVHYTKKEDREAHDALLCIRTNSGLKPGDDPVRLEDKHDSRRVTYDGDGYHVLSEEEMRERFPGFEEAIQNTQKIADRCNVEFTFHETKMPAYQVPEGFSAFSYLKKLCMDGLKERYPDADNTARAEYELNMIRKMGFVEYFLIVWDFIHWAKTHGVPVGPGRGSAAGSIVAYAIGITDIDPIKYNLLFERFLNPERVSMPDIDVDFCMDNRHRVVEYVKEKYGSDCVCQIVTFGTFAARQIIKDVGKCMGLSVAERDAFAKLVPAEPGITLAKAREQSSEFAEACSRYEDLYKVACSLEGLPRQTGTHAAGVIICDRPVSDYIPLSVREGQVQSQFNMTEVEELGLLKMDFLGLRTLTAIEETKKNIKARYGYVPDIVEEDPAVYEMISTGKTTGVFQLESAGMQDFMQNLRPTCIGDLIAGVALYRPGPMDFIPAFVEGKKNPAGVRYLCPQLEPILKDTYGCIVYQEQVMQIFQKLAGYSLGRADIVRRAMSKKKASVLEAEKGVFIDGCVKNGIDSKTAEKIFSSMEEFARYAFNKSHAAAYATVCYQTAWLMCHYPTEYLAAIMTSVITDKDKVKEYAQAAKERGISLKHADINLSGPVFTPISDSEILFGIGGVANVGQAAAEKFCKNRRSPYRTFQDAVRGLSDAGITSKGIECLANAGAFSCFGGHRSQYAAAAKTALTVQKKGAKKLVEGQLSLFEFVDLPEPDIDLPDIPEYSSFDLCEKELEACGMYVSGGPLDSYRTFSSTLKKARPDLKIGLVKKLKRHEAKNGTMAFLTIELEDGEEKDFVAFSGVYSVSWSKLLPNAVIVFHLEKENVIDGVEDIRDYPCNVNVQTGEDTLEEDKNRLFLAGELFFNRDGKDELHAYYRDQSGDCKKALIGSGNLKDETALQAIRREFGENRVHLAIVKR